MINRAVSVLMVTCFLFVFVTCAPSQTTSNSDLEHSDLDPSPQRHAHRKRQWESDMRVWGKRSQAADDSSRSSADLENGEQPREEAAAAGADKRSWNKESGLRVWGKRQWAQNDAMRVWGKRSSGQLGSAGQKRQWHDNSKALRVWGKRSTADQVADGVDKRQWNDNSKALRVWGKRSGWSANTAKLNSKRGWDTRSIPVWGKR